MSRKPKAAHTLSAGERVALMNEKIKEEEVKRAEAAVERCDVKKPLPVKKELPKPQYATIKVDCGVKNGRIAKIHGMMNGPMSFGADISSLFREIGVPCVRYHNTDTEMSRYAFDISRIFPNFEANELDLDNYHFEVTDRYIAAAYNAGAEVLYRFGESDRDVGLSSYIGGRTDYAKWSRICINIIKHYNEFWKNGFAYGLKYFEFAYGGEGYTDEVFELYSEVSRAVKSYNSELMIGGISFSSCDDELRSFLRYCKKRELPLDFVSFNISTSSPEAITDILRKYEKTKGLAGYGESELIIGNWNYLPTLENRADAAKILQNEGGKHSTECRALHERMCGIEGAAYAAAMLIEANNSELVSSAFFGDAQPMVSGNCVISDRFGNPEKVYHAFCAYGKLYRARDAIMCISEQQDGMKHTGIYASAAMAESGEVYILISSFDGCGSIDLRLDGIPDNLYNAEVYLLDGVRDLELTDSLPLSGAKKRMILNLSKYGVALIRVY